MCKVLLGNDYWCKGLGQTQPKSAAYQEYRAMVRERREAAGNADALGDPVAQQALVLDDALAGAMPDDERATSGVGWPE